MCGSVSASRAACVSTPFDYHARWHVRADMITLICGHIVDLQGTCICGHRIRWPYTGHTVRQRMASPSRHFSTENHQGDTNRDRDTWILTVMMTSCSKSPLVRTDDTRESEFPERIPSKFPTS